jgi:hypothetical protein
MYFDFGCRAIPLRKDGISSKLGKTEGDRVGFESQAIEALHAVY